MTTRQARQSLRNNWNLNSTIGAMTIASMVLAGVFYIAPLRTLPTHMEDLQKHIQEVQTVQAVQTAALQTLADVAADTKAMRRDVDSNTSRIEDTRRRLDRLENRQP